MKKIVVIIIMSCLYNCQNFGQLKLVSDLSKELKEVSGHEIIGNSPLIWMINDGGNKSILYGVTKNGTIKKEIEVDAKNHDWEDLTTDDEGNIYIGDFGNNNNKRENLKILKIKKEDLNKKKVAVEKIKFEYPEQDEFPPKKKELFYDTEAFFYFKNHFYIFTKSRVKGEFGTTLLYKVPAQSGKHKAQLLDKYENCNMNVCWITSADISKNKKKIVLLSQNNVLIFSNFTGDNFFSGDVREIEFTNNSQKEGVCFKNTNTLLITDERTKYAGGNLYKLKIE